MLGPEPRGGSLCERLSETCFVQSSGVGVVGGIGKASTRRSCRASLTPASPSALCEQEGDSTRPPLLRRCHFSPHFPAAPLGRPGEECRPGPTLCPLASRPLPGLCGR